MYYCVFGEFLIKMFLKVPYYSSLIQKAKVRFDYNFSYYAVASTVIMFL